VLQNHKLVRIVVDEPELEHNMQTIRGSHVAYSWFQMSNSVTSKSAQSCSLDLKPGNVVVNDVDQKRERERPPRLSSSIYVCRG
jgi:hypothetical protein